MDWSSFLGALAGTVISVVVIVGIIVLWDYVTQRRAARNRPVTPQSLTLDNILESQLESFIVDNFAALFPGWQIYDEPTGRTPGENGRPAGIQYHTKAGRIDILARDPRQVLVVIELKKDKAPDKVAAQVERYMNWVRTHLAEPGQKVRGLIIAKSIDDRLAHSLARKRGVNIWRYEWQLKFNKSRDWRIVTTPPNPLDDTHSANTLVDSVEE